MIYWGAFLLGIASSLHCLGMCGPLQAAALGATIRKGKWHWVASYQLARIGTYALLGLMVSILGLGIGIQQWQQEISLGTGLILLFAFLAFYLLKMDRRLYSIFSPYLSRLRTRLIGNKELDLTYYLGSGFLNGLLPCGMVYLAMFSSFSAPNGLGGTLYMIVFGLGTLPLLMFGHFAIPKLLQQSQKLQKLIPFTIVLAAFLLILRGMNLDIPYISPAQKAISSTTEVCY